MAVENIDDKIKMPFLKIFLTFFFFFFFSTFLTLEKSDIFLVNIFLVD
jgi:hypothetical protein